MYLTLCACACSEMLSDQNGMSVIGRVCESHVSGVVHSHTFPGHVLHFSASLTPWAFRRTPFQPPTRLMWYRSVFSPASGLFRDGNTEALEKVPLTQHTGLFLKSDFRKHLHCPHLRTVAWSPNKLRNIIKIMWLDKHHVKRQIQIKWNGIQLNGNVSTTGDVGCIRLITVVSLLLTAQ